MIMKYTSISRNFRGYNYQADWQRAEDWALEMGRQAEKENEIEWSILVFVPGGMPTMKYSRGAEIISLAND